MPSRPQDPPAKVRRIGPNCRPVTLAKLDGRTREAALMRWVRADLTAHCGSPSVVQRALIERAVILSLRCAQIDAKIVAGEALMFQASAKLLSCNPLERPRRRGLAAGAVMPPRLLLALSQHRQVAI